MSNTLLQLTPPSYVLKMFIMNKSSCLKADSNPNYQELVKMFKEKVESHNSKVRDSKYADSGFDLIIQNTKMVTPKIAYQM